LKKEGKIWLPGLSKAISFEMDGGWRWLNVTTLSAMFAVLISLLSLWFSMYQAHLSQRPYLDVGSYGQNLPEIGVRISNKGVGPALIVRIEITFGRRKLKTFDELYQQLRLHAKFTSIVRYTDTSVLAVGEHEEVIRIIDLNNKSDQDGAWKSIQKDIQIRVTYCSLFKQCWDACLHANENCRDVEI
jgi:hypothetical protein